MRCSIALLLLLMPVTLAADEPADKIDFAKAVAEVQKVAQQEVERGIVSGVSIALVHDQQLLFAGGFGLADKAKQLPAKGDMVYRAGSISKLFNAIAAMQLAEQGKFDLDAPIESLDERVQFVNPFDDRPAMTARQLLCHRSGMIRESPVGGYLDDSQPGIAASIASIAPCVLVHRPNTKTKYSNIGPTIVGQVVEKISGESFNDYQHEHIFAPLGMKHSSFLMNDELRPHFSNSYMRVANADGTFREIETPFFELGTIPAGNLYTSAEDLAKFCSMLLARGTVGEEQILKPESLDAMWKTQLVDTPTGFGLGFSIGTFREQRSISHMGAVYGFTSSVMVLPELKLGVVVLGNEDIAVGPISKLNRLALGWLVDAKSGVAPPAESAPAEPPSDVANFAGQFESPSYWAEITLSDGKLVANISSQPLELTPAGEGKFIADGRFADNSIVEFQRNETGDVIGFTALNQKFTRVASDPPAIPDAWKKYIGNYGPTFIPLVISERHGHLYAMTENMMDYRLRPIAPQLFGMPPGLYEDEYLLFQTNRRGEVYGAILANMPLEKRSQEIEK